MKATDVKVAVSSSSSLTSSSASSASSKPPHTSASASLRLLANIVNQATREGLDESKCKSRASGAEETSADYPSDLFDAKRDRDSPFGNDDSRRFITSAKLRALQSAIYKNNIAEAAVNDDFELDKMTGKPPFLPRLPQKLLSTWLEPSHFINRVYVQVDPQTGNESKVYSSSLNLNCSSKRNFGSKSLNDISNSLERRPNTSTKPANQVFQGDLLRATQVCKALDKNCSKSIKRIRTAETFRSQVKQPSTLSLPQQFNGASNPTFMRTAKPFHSMLKKSPTEKSGFFSKSNNPVECQPEQPTESKESKACETKKRGVPSQSSMFGLNYERLPRHGEDMFSAMKQSAISTYLLEKANSSTLENMKTLLSSTESISKSDQITSQPDVALHALDTIWEIHSCVLGESPVLSQLYLKYTRSK